MKKSNVHFILYNVDNDKRKTRDYNNKIFII